MPKGGYTIVPLRAANARTLIEQSIGRGLRLPYGKRTGVAAVDRLNIVAHDKFQEIIDEANRGDSPIRLKQVILDAPSADDKKVSVQVGSGAAARLGLTDAAPAVDPASAAAHGGSGGGEAKPAPTPVFTTEAEKQAARVVIEVIGKLETQRDLVPTSGALLTPEVQKVIQAEVAERLKPMQGNLLAGADEAIPALDLSVVVAKTTEIVVQQTIDIPRIAVVPIHGTVITLSDLHQGLAYPDPNRLRQVLLQDYGRHDDFAVIVDEKRLDVDDVQGSYSNATRCRWIGRRNARS